MNEEQLESPRWVMLPEHPTRVQQKPINMNFIELATSTQ